MFLEKSFQFNLKNVIEKSPKCQIVNIVLQFTLSNLLDILFPEVTIFLSEFISTILIPKYLFQKQQKQISVCLTTIPLNKV